MKIDVRLREELAQKLYEESDRTGVAWVRRPESVKHAFREAAERKLKIRTEGHGGQNHGHGHNHKSQSSGHDRPRHTAEAHRPSEANHTRSKPVMEPCTR